MKKIYAILMVLILAAMAHANNDYLHHDIKAGLQPDIQFIRVTDTIHIPGSLLKGKKKLHFLLHGNLTIKAVPKDVKLIEETGELKAQFFGINTAEFEIKKEIPLKHYSLTFNEQPAAEGKSITISYEGKIHHPIKKVGAEYARGFSQTPGIISDKGAFLAGATFWTPWFNDDLVTFKLEAVVPVPWSSASQGKLEKEVEKDGLRSMTWFSPEPMDEVYLIAAPFWKYRIDVGNVAVMAFLRSADDSLANKYLETTGQYLEMYEKLIGPYPYSKFMLIENFWETGYGMPSFTLLGPQVIRFPFILHSSYPHELLHNWWGNSVFVDYESGNWCEGLTVYHADHLIKEQRGQGEEYRKTTLQGYTHYAAGKKEEFPLTRFKARYNALSSSIGYGKSAMLYHMLRRKVGDKAFTKGFQHFYRENKFKRATFGDIRKSFESVTGKDLGAFFQQWVTRAGVPEIRITGAVVKKNENGFLLSFALEQLQAGDAYVLDVPAAITLKGNPDAEIKQLAMKEKRMEFQFSFDKEPLAVDIDPQFDVFRKLHSNEIPATFSNAFGAKDILILLPSKAPAGFLDGYKKMAENWAKESNGKIKIKTDSDVQSLPPDKAVWLFGKENIHTPLIAEEMALYNAQFTSGGVTIAKKGLAFNANSVIAAVKNPNNKENVVVFMSTDQTAALPGLGRKLPHYGKYSYLAFEGDEPANHFKGQWPAVNSPMSVNLAKSAVKAKLPKAKPLGRLAPLFSAKRMTDHIRYLASEQLEGRGLGYKGLEKAAHYIAVAFKNAGLKPGGDNGSFFQTWETEIDYKGLKKKISVPPMRNVIGVIPGTNPAFKGQSAIICAHYDHLGLGWPDVREGNKGKIHLGADDNASGVAVMLELAHSMGKSFKPERTIVFIAFTGEESGLLGSRHYVKSLDKSALKNIMGVVNLDTVGRLSEKSKLMVIGGSSAREWRFIFMGIGYTVGVETQLVTQDLDASDQVSFINEGVPGIQLFSGPHTDYHRPSDTVDKIETAGLLKVAAVAREAIVYLSGRKKPMTVTIKGKESKPAAPAASGSQGGRRVRTGLMPDFAFSGKGVKVGAVSPGSPMAIAGVKKGDVIVKLGGVTVTSLREYSNKLKTYKPGDTTEVVYLRDSKEYKTTLTLSAR